jgi:L-ribulokinase
MYRALLESTALGTRLVLDTFTQGGVSVDRLVVGGGLATNDLMLQIYADATGLPVEVVSSEQPSARGAAILGAAAAGLFDSVTAAVVAAADPPARFFEPDARAGEAYDELYSVYRELVAELGASGSPLKRLSALRRRTAGDLSSSFPYSADLRKELQR